MGNLIKNELRSAFNIKLVLQVHIPVMGKDVLLMTILSSQMAMAISTVPSAYCRIRVFPFAALLY